MIAKRVYSDATHFRIFTPYIISADEGLRLVAHCFLNRALSRYSSAASSLGAAPSRQDFATALSGIATQRGRTFPFCQWPS
jgi:hypothetical protein